MINFFEKEKVTDPNFWIVMYITGASQTTELDACNFYFMNGNFMKLKIIYCNNLRYFYRSL